MVRGGEEGGRKEEDNWGYTYTDEVIQCNDLKVLYLNN